MKLRKMLTSIIAAALAVSALTISAFAEDIDYTAEAEANKGLFFNASSAWAGGQWVIGNDSAAMENPLTIEDLENMGFFEIHYTSTEVPPALSGEGAKLTFIYKFVTEMDDATGKPKTMEAYLPQGWVEYGPNPDDGSGNTYLSTEYFAFDPKAEGVLYIPTQAILDSIKDKDAIQYMWQFGIGCNTYDYDTEFTDESIYGADYEINITKVLLRDKDAVMPETEAPVTQPVTEAPKETEATIGTTVTTTESTSAPETPAQNNTFPVIPVVIGGVAAIAVIIVIIVIASKKK